MPIPPTTQTGEPRIIDEAIVWTWVRKPVRRRSPPLDNGDQVTLRWTGMPKLVMTLTGIVMCGRPLRRKGKSSDLVIGLGAVMCPASKDAVLMTAGHDELHELGPGHGSALKAQDNA